MFGKIPALALAASVLALSFPAASVAGPSSPADAVGSTTVVKVQAQEWQKRRAKTAEAFLGAVKGSKEHLARFDKVLTDFERSPLSFTPVEAVELVAAYYVPKDGLNHAGVAMLAAVQTLGWYDALRYGTASGRAEIVDNENFFRMPLLGENNAKAKEELVALMRQNPELVRSWVEEGLAMAEASRETQKYDRKWPSAYGLERLQCAMGGRCAAPKAAPKESWDALWEQSKARVFKYWTPDLSGTN